MAYTYHIQGARLCPASLARVQYRFGNGHLAFGPIKDVDVLLAATEVVIGEGKNLLPFLCRDVLADAFFITFERRPRLAESFYREKP